MMQALRNFSIFLVLLLPLLAQGQATFQKLYSNYDIRYYDLTQLSDGGYALVGLGLDTLQNERQVLVTRTDCKGEVLWSFSYGQGSALGPNGGNILVDLDGNLVVAANRGNATNSEVLLSKIDLGGSLIWQQTIGGTAPDVVADLIQTTDSGYVMAGYTQSFLSPGGLRNVYLLKTDRNGNLQWAHSIGGAQHNGEATSLIETSDGGFALGGTANFGSTHQGFLLKTDAAGILQWGQYLGSNLSRTEVHDLKELVTGEYVLSGHSTLLNGSIFANTDAFLTRTNNLGVPAWTKFYSTGQFIDDRSYTLVETPTGFGMMGTTDNFGTASTIPTKFFFLETDPGGIVSQARTYGSGGEDYPSLIEDQLGGWTFCGATNDTNYFFPGGYAGYLIKTDSAFVSDCNEADRTPQVIEIDTAFTRLDSLFPLLTNAGTVLNVSDFDTMDVSLRTECESFISTILTVENDTACFGDTAVLVAMTNPQVTVNWYTSPTADTPVFVGDTLLLTLPGTVTYYVKALGGPNCDTVRTPVSGVVKGIAPTTANADPGNTTYPEVEVEFWVTDTIGVISWAWEFGDGQTSSSANPFHSYEDPGNFMAGVTIEDTAGCIQNLIVPVNVSGDTLAIPNVLTPNGDGINDALLAEHFGIVEFQINVFDRWGHPIYSSGTKSFLWDGTNSAGNPVNEGVYFYVVEGVTWLGEEKNFTGNLTILK